MSRRVLLQAGAAAVVAGGLAGRAAAAPPDGDLAFVRLLLATELLADRAEALEARLEESAGAERIMTRFRHETALAALRFVDGHRAEAPSP
jgi:hypothetical protein